MSRDRLQVMRETLGAKSDDGPAEPAGGGPRSRRQPLDRRPLAIALAVLVSVGFHGGLTWWLADQPIGTVDLAAINAADGLYVVRRPDRDLILDPAADGPGTDGEDPARDLADVSRRLLTAEPDTSAAADTGSDSPADPEPLPDDRPMPDRANPEPTPLTDAATAALARTRSPDVDLPFQTTGGDPSGAAISDDDGRSAAEALLAGDPDLPTDTTPGTPSLNPTGSGPLDRPADTTATAGVDFVKIALDQSTDLNVPVHLDDDFDYEVTRYQGRAPGRDGWFAGDDADPDDGWFRVRITPRETLRKLPTMPKDVIYLIDTSESVPQEWVEQAIRGVSGALAALNEGDRFNIVFFSEKPAFFRPRGVVAATEENLAAARTFLEKAESQGMTDVNEALSRLLVRDLAAQRVYRLVLISDGRPTRGVMDTRELINLITRDNANVASIYCIGIGPKQNQPLLEFLAYRNRGYCRFVDTSAGAAGIIRDLASRLRYPILTDIRLSTVGLADNEVYPRRVPDIHQGQRLEVFGRFDQTGVFTMRLAGRNRQAPMDFTFTRDLARAQKGDQTIARRWGFWKLHHLYSRILVEGETDELLEQIKALKKTYELKTLY